MKALESHIEERKQSFKARMPLLSLERIAPLTRERVAYASLLRKAEVNSIVAQKRLKYQFEETGQDSLYGPQVLKQLNSYLTIDSDVIR